MTATDQKTIEDFGAQWTRYTDNDGYHGSVALLADHIEPLMTLDDIKGLRCADIGSGTGRIVMMLLGAGAERVTGVEPSDAFFVMQNNTRHLADRIDYVHAGGEDLPLGDFDLVVSFGVLHHVVDPAPIVQRALAALKPGGRLAVWLYGHEGNETYLAFALPLRALTKRMPDWMLVPLAHTLNAILGGYILLCKVLPLPMRRYMVDYLDKIGAKKRVQTVFDQLNPAYAKYYRRDEAKALLADNGFVNVQLHHRHGYSWTVVGQRPREEGKS